MFCREIGWKEDEEAVEAREGVCNMTDIFAMPYRRPSEGQASEPDAPAMSGNAAHQIELRSAKGIRVRGARQRSSGRSKSRKRLQGAGSMLRRIPIPIPIGSERERDAKTKKKVIYGSAEESRRYGAGVGRTTWLLVGVGVARGRGQEGKSVCEWPSVAREIAEVKISSPVGNGAARL